MLGIEGSQVRPDMYVLGRGWAAGVPFGACVTGSSALHWDAAGAGSPVGSAVALEVIRLLESGLLEQMKPVVAELERRLTVLCSGTVAVAASGQGLFWTLLFSAERKVAAGFAARCREAGLLLRVLGDDVVGIRPPLVVTEVQVVDAIGTVERVLSTFGKKT
jgi:acetylornithine/succinyldiaminopimelate/putrescine aminotransferase